MYEFSQDLLKCYYKKKYVIHDNNSHLFDNKYSEITQSPFTYSKEMEIICMFHLLNFVFETHESISLKINQTNLAFLEMSEKLRISLSFNKNS